MAERDPDVVERISIFPLGNPVDGGAIDHTACMTNDQHPETDPPQTTLCYTMYQIASFFNSGRDTKYTWNDGLADIAAGDTISLWGTSSSTGNLELRAYISTFEVNDVALMTVPFVNGGYTTFTLDSAFVTQIQTNGDLGDGKFSVRISFPGSGSAVVFCYEADADLTPPAGGVIIPGTADIAGEASVGTQGQVIMLRSASIAGAAEVSATPNHVRVSSASISGAASVDAVGSVVHEVSASISGSAEVGTVTNMVRSVSVSVVGNATVVATGTTSSVTFKVVNIAGEATLEVIGNHVLPRVVSIGGAATVGVVANHIRVNGAEITGSATIDAVVSQVKPRSASLLGAATVVAQGAIGALHTIDKAEEVILGGVGLESIHVYSDGVEYWILD